MGPRTPLVARYDLGAVAVRADFGWNIAHLRHPHLHAAGAHPDLASGQVSVAVTPELSGPLVAEPPKNSSTSRSTAAWSAF